MFCTYCNTRYIYHLSVMNKKIIPLSRRHTWRFYTPIAANLIAGENRLPIGADTLGDFFR